MKATLIFLLFFLSNNVLASESLQLSPFTRSEDPWQAGLRYDYLRFKVGGFYDSNPFALFDQEIFPLLFPIESEGGLQRTELAGHLFRDVHDPEGLGFRGKIKIRTDFYPEKPEYYNWQVDTGPTWQAGNLFADLLLHVGQQFYSNRLVSTYTGIQPTVTLTLAPEIDLYGGYRFRYEWFRDSLDDNYDHHTGFVGVRYRIQDHLLSLAVDGSRHHNEFRLPSYWESGVQFNWFALWPFGFESRVGLAYHHRDYDGMSGFFSPIRDARDERFNSNLTLVKHFAHGIFLEAKWDFALRRGRRSSTFFFDEESFDLDYDRHVAGLSIGIAF